MGVAKLASCASVSTLSANEFCDGAMAWFKLTDPNGDPVQVNGDQLACIRVPLVGVSPGPPIQAMIEFTTGHTQATLETPAQILDLIAGRTAPEETAGPVGAIAPLRHAMRRKK
jgi:hypothetical protein